MGESMRHNRTRPAVSCSQLAIISLLLLFCLLTVGVFWAVESLPRQAAQVFGPPGRSLGTFQRFSYAVQLLWNQDNLLKPVDAGAEEQDFVVEMGESVNSVALRLENAGLIRDAAAFRLYLIYAGLDTGLQAGHYQLSAGFSALEVAHHLQDATPNEVTFTVLPGWRLEEIAAALPTSGLAATPEEFLQLARKPDTSLLPDNFPKVKTLEGYLLPGSYQLKRQTTAEQLITMLTAEFMKQVTPELQQAIESHGLSLTEAVKLASIVQREAMVTDEQPMIASVFYNRLETGMRLESDPTVQYALGYNKSQKTWWTNPLSSEDLQVDSRYNTYMNNGLPPGPICSPGLSALNAVAYPAKSPYLYFRARCDGSGRHAFSQTYEEHLQNACP